MYPVALRAQAVRRQESLVITEDLSPTTNYYNIYFLRVMLFSTGNARFSKKNYTLAIFFNATTVARYYAVHQMVSGL